MPNWLRRLFQVPSQQEIDARLNLAYALGRLDMARELMNLSAVQTQATREAIDARLH